METLKRLTLIFEKYCNAYAISPKFVDSIEFDEIESIDQEAIIRRICVKIATSGAKKVEVEYPTTLWDYIKQSWAPAWFIKKYPISKNTVVFDCRELFPEYSPIRKGDGRLDITVSTGNIYTIKD